MRAPASVEHDVKSRFRQSSDQKPRILRTLLLLLVMGVIGAIVYVAILPPEPEREMLRIDIPNDRFPH